jgi:DNA-directed RNA polymerase specialized sigma24 family protein
VIQTKISPMPAQQPAKEAEVLLQQWLDESDEVRSRDLLESLMRQHVEPLVRRIVGFKLGPAGGSRNQGTSRADIEDVCGTALYNLLAHLNRVKSGDSGASVRNFNGYAAVTAYNACHEYFRARKPEWARLAMKLRYLATHDSRFSLWQVQEGQDVLGFARDRGRQPGDLAHSGEVGETLRSKRDPARLTFSQSVECVLDAANGPLVLEDLVDVVAEWLGIKETQIESLDAEDNKRAHPREVVRGAQAENYLSDREYIERLWQEICGLPLEHRRALLLNLEDAAGGDIQLFDFLGIATVRQIAVTLEMDPLVFAEMWRKLPLDDATIGGQIGLSRQDVANRRSAARKRLARKMRDWEIGK